MLFELKSTLPSFFEFFVFCIFVILVFLSNIDSQIGMRITLVVHGDAVHALVGDDGGGSHFWREHFDLIGKGLFDVVHLDEMGEQRAAVVAPVEARLALELLVRARVELLGYEQQNNIAKRMPLIVDIEEQQQQKAKRT